MADTPTGTEPKNAEVKPQGVTTGAPVVGSPMIVSYNREIFKQLKVLRKKNNRDGADRFNMVTQKQLANEIGMSQQAVVKLEKGKFSPSFEAILKMANFFYFFFTFFHSFLYVA